MLHIILQILSIIGMILLCIIGLLLVLILLVLFVPIRYQLKGSLDTKHFEIDVRISWLLRLIRVSYAYPMPATVVAKILWFNIFDSGKEEVPKEKNVGAEASLKGAITKEAVTDETITKESATDKTVTKEAGTKETVAKDTLIENEAIEEEEKTSKIQKIRYTIKGLCDKIKAVFQNIKYYIDLLQEEDNKLLLSRCKNRLLKVLFMILPKRIKANVLFGTGAPDTTGYLLGAYYSMIYPKLGKNIAVNIEPDFYNLVLESDFYAKGRLRIFTALWIALQLWRDPQLKIFINKLKMED